MEQVFTLKFIISIVVGLILALASSGCNEDARKLKHSINAPQSTISSPTYSFKIQPKDTKQAIKRHIIAEARKARINPIIPLAIASVESNFKPHARSHVGAIGVMQIMPANAKRCKESNPVYLNGAATNIKCGIRIIKEELAIYNGNLEQALRVYNGGPKCLKFKCSESEKYAAKINYLITYKHIELMS